MDSQNIIDLSSNPEELDIEMNRWLSLSFDQRKRSDDACMIKYGCTNTELYNRTKSMIVKHTNLPSDPIELSSTVFESFNTNPTESDNLTNQSLYNKIQTSDMMQDNDGNIIIINEFLDDNNPDYDFQNLLLKYNKYLNLPMNYKELSDGYSISLWGRSVPQMYTFMKNKLETKSVEDNSLYLKTVTVHGKEDARLTQYDSDIKESTIKEDIVGLLIHKIDCSVNSKNRTLYESAVLKSLAERSIVPQHDFSSDVPMITPYFTYNEWDELTGNQDNVLPMQYILIDDPKAYKDIIVKLQSILPISPDKAIIEDKLIKLGWNPYIPITAESMQYARNKQIRWINENEACNIVDISKFNTKSVYSDDCISEGLEDNKLLEPVFIVLTYTNTAFGKVITTFENCKYSHSGLSLSAVLKKIFTFSIHPEKANRSNGISIESIDKYDNGTGDADIMVLCMFVTKEIKKKIEDICNWYITNKNKTRYALNNVLNIVANRPVENKPYSLQMICSQFVDSVLKMCNIDVTGKNSNLVSPTDFTKPANGAKLFKVFEGKKTKYSPNSVISKVNYLRRSKSYNDLIVTNQSNVMESLTSNFLEGLNVSCSDNKEVDNMLTDLRNQFTISPVIVQEMKLPFRFSSKGDLIINLPKDIQREYEEAHKLLSIYDESNIDGIKHELARLYYLNFLIEKRLKKVKKDDKEYKELIDMRARILNDFTVYFKIVKVKDKSFDFSKYLKTTEYYTKDMVIDSSTLKTSGAIIEKIIKTTLK